MDAGNLVVGTIGVAALTAAALIGWRGRQLPIVVAQRLPDRHGASALDGLRTMAAIMGAGLVAGILVPGLGGRAYMRLMAVTSGADAQGRLTEAEEVVGDITFGGTIGFVGFVGMVLPAVAAIGYLGLRHFLPNRVASGSSMFGVLLLGLFGVDDPLSPDNVDFEILGPLWLAVGGIVALSILFAWAFGALATRFDRGLEPLGSSVRAIPGHAGLAMAVVPPFVFVTAPYVLLRGVLRGRARPLLEQRAVRAVGTALVGVATIVAAIVSIDAAAQIL